MARAIKSLTTIQKFVKIGQQVAVTKPESNLKEIGEVVGYHSIGDSALVQFKEDFAQGHDGNGDAVDTDGGEIYGDEDRCWFYEMSEITILNGSPPASKKGLAHQVESLLAIVRGG